MMYKVMSLFFLFIGFSVSIGFTQTLQSEHEAIPTYKVGILSFTDKSETYTKWSPLEDYLNRTIELYNIEVVPLFYEELNEAVANRTVDFVFTNPGHFVQLKTSYALSGAIATLIPMDDGMIQPHFGGVIFTAANQPSLNTMNDLKGKTIAAVSKSSLGGYQASAYELYMAGLDLDKDVTFTFTGMPHSNTVKAVLNGEADAGFVRTGVLESMIADEEISTGEIKIINAQDNPGFNQILSTKLYPEWPFAVMEHVNLEESRSMASALLMLCNESEYSSLIGINGFNIPSNYLVVEEMMHALKLYPFDTTTRITLSDIWDDYSYYILIVVMLLTASTVFITYKVYSEHKLKQKNETLNQLMAKLEESMKENEYLSFHDHLTGLYNRRFFEADQQAKDKEEYLPLSVVVGDLNGLKHLNDTLGHNAGDELIIKTAEILKNIFRSQDTIARIGGDEFAVLLPNTDKAATEALIAKIKTAMNDLSIQGEDASIALGFDTKNTLSTPLEEVLITAENAMYKDKEKGKNKQ